MSNMDPTRLMLRYAAEVYALTEEEASAVRKSPTYLSDIQAAVAKKLPPFSGLTERQKRELQAYLVFLSENAFVDEAAGQTPMITSVKMVLDEEGPYRGRESDLDYDLAMNLNKLKKRGQSPLAFNIGIDAHGKPFAMKDPKDG